MKKTNFYASYKKRYREATPEQRMESFEHWTKCHMENMKSGRPELLTFSARMLKIMSSVDLEESVEYFKNN